MAPPIKRNLLEARTSLGLGPEWTPDFGAVIAASLQAEWSGDPKRIVIAVRALLDGETRDTLCVLDTANGYVNGEIVNLILPVGIEKIRAELVTLDGASAVSLYLRARE